MFFTWKNTNLDHTSARYVWELINCFYSVMKLSYSLPSCFWCWYLKKQLVKLPRLAKKRATSLFTEKFLFFFLARFLNQCLNENISWLAEKLVFPKYIYKAESDYFKNKWILQLTINTIFYLGIKLLPLNTEE